MTTAHLAWPTDPLDPDLERELDVLRRAGLYRSLRKVERTAGLGTLALAGGRPVHDFSSNDYLGLATDPRVAQAIAEAVRRYGAGATASRSIAGNHPLHEALEAELARLKGKEAALLFPSGMLANMGTIPALAGRGDVIYSDELNHASILDGCRLTRATVRSFPHADVGALATLLEQDAGKYRRRLVVVEGVYSMDGDLFPLDRLAPLARAHGAAIYLDDAHATGVVGRTGAGSGEHWGVSGIVSVHLGTLGKAFGVSGGFIAGSGTLREFLLNRVRSFIFTTASAPALASGALAAIGLMHAEPWRRDRLQANVARLSSGLAALGRPLRPDVPGHIAPIVLRDSRQTTQAGGLLLERGFLVGVVRPPSVPVGRARLRITVSAGHTDEQIDALLNALGDVLPSIG
jgi:8-amino-7-oxononanoate synthase